MSTVTADADAASAPRERNSTLDGLKYLAAAAIVLHHVSLFVGGGRIGEFLIGITAVALYFFFAVSGYLHGGLGGRGAAWRLGRLWRLGVPYAVWSAVYLLWGQRQILGGAAPHWPNPLMVLFFAGAHGILWFLPVLLACAVICDVFVRTPDVRRGLMVAAAAATIAVYWSGLPTTVAPAWIDFVLAPQWLFTYLAGMEIRAAKRLPAPTLALGLAIASAVLVAGVLRVEAGRFSVVLWSCLQAGVWAGSAALILIGCASGLPMLGAGRLAWGRDYLLGIYLSHVIFLSWFAAHEPVGTLPTVLWVLAAWAFSFTLSVCLTWLLLRGGRTRLAVT